MEFPEFKDPQYTYKATVTKIVDGDTIDVILDLGCHTTVSKRLRFMGIDTWEVRGEEKVEGKIAKERLIEMLEGQEVLVQTIMDSTGKYGRLLAWVWIKTDQGPINVNNLLLEEGHGVEYGKK